MIILVLAIFTVMMFGSAVFLEKKFRFVNEFIFGSFVTLGILSAIAVVICCSVAIINQATANGTRAYNQEIYKALTYKAQHGNIKDEFGLLNKEYLDEVQEWNGKISSFRYYSQSKWIGVFYPKQAIDGVDTINLEEFEMR